MDSHHPADGQIDAEASEWLVRLLDLEPDRDEAYSEPEDRQAAFYRWVSRSRRHLVRFLEVVETYRKLHDIDPHHRITARDRSPEELTNVVPLKRSSTASERACAARDNARFYLPLDRAATHDLRHSRWLWATVALAVLLLLPLGFQHLAAASQSYATGIGQRLVIPLEDGSEVQLNTNSKVSVKFTSYAREIHLAQGEALFNVAHDLRRPFLVRTDDATIRDVGTKFTVYRPAEGETRVAVLEGRVEIFRNDAQQRSLYPVTSAEQPEIGADSAASTVLDAGKKAELNHHGRVTTLRISDVSAHDLERELSWRVGLLVFEGQTLAQEIAEFNRYNRRQLVLDDPSLARLQLGGAFLYTNPEMFAVTVGKTFNVRVLPAASDSDAIHLAGIR